MRRVDLGEMGKGWRAFFGVFGAMVLGWILAGCSLPDLKTELTPRSRSGTGSGSVSWVRPEAWQAEAHRWIGTPYHRGGSERSGADCSGFVQQVFRRVARVEIPRVTRDQFRLGFEVGRSDLRAGDLVFFETGASGSGVSHVGLMVGADRFAHASTSRGVIYSRLSEAYWAQRFLGARRHP